MYVSGGSRVLLHGNQPCCACQQRYMLPDKELRGRSAVANDVQEDSEDDDEEDEDDVELAARFFARALAFAAFAFAFVLGTGTGTGAAGRRPASKSSSSIGGISGFASSGIFCAMMTAKGGRVSLARTTANTISYHKRACFANRGIVVGILV